MSVRIFLCHSHNDKILVRRLAIDLQAAGLDVWLDEWAINVGESILQRVQDGLRESTFLVACVSPDALRSPWCREELNAAFLQQMTHQHVRVLPALLRDSELPPFLQDKKYADFRKSYTLGLQALLSAIRGRTPDSPTFDQLLDRIRVGQDLSVSEFRLLSAQEEQHEESLSTPDIQLIASYALRARCSVATWLRALHKRLGRDACVALVRSTLSITDTWFEKCLTCAFPQDQESPRKLFAEMMGYQFEIIYTIPKLSGRRIDELELALTYLSLIGSDAALRILNSVVGCTGNWCERGFRHALRTKDPEFITLAFEATAETLSTPQTRQCAVLELCDALSVQEISEYIYKVASGPSHMLFTMMADANLWPPTARRHMVQAGLESRYSDIRKRARACIAPHEEQLLEWASTGADPESLDSKP